MPADLHQQILDRLAPSEPFSELVYEALRTVVELHAPVRAGLNWFECHGCEPGSHATDRPDWPCETTRTIARELGVEVSHA